MTELKPDVADVVNFLRKRADECHQVDLYLTTASRSTIFNAVADEIVKEFRTASKARATTEVEVGPIRSNRHSATVWPTPPTLS